MTQVEAPLLQQPVPLAVPVARVAWRRMALRVGVSGIMIVALLLFLPREQIWSALSKVSLAALGASVMLYLSLHLLGVTKWRLLVNLAGAGLERAQAARCYYGGLFGNLFLPSILGGDVVRAGLAFGQTRSRTGLILGSVLDRILDVTALATVAAIGALLLPDRLEMVGRNVVLPLAAALVVLALVVLALWMTIPARRLPFKVRRRMARLRQAIKPMIQRPQYVILALTLGIALQSCLVLLNASLGRACGLECPLAVWFFVWPLAKLSAVLPLTQGGVGVREAALAALFVSFDVPAAMAVAVGLVFEAVVISGALIAGPLAVVLGRLPRPQRAIARA
jgi:uncharacterized protein (TIRG00374 family)